MRAWRVPHPSPACVVTFGNYEDQPEGWATGFGQGFLDRAGLDAIHVVPRANDWYQHGDMPAALAAVRAAAAGKPVFTYGSSMGAYAALRFGGALGAAAAIALSPQFSLDPAVVPHERRWRPEAARLRFLDWDRPGFAPAPGIVFYDPCGPDAAHAALWAASGPMTPVPLPHAGHPAGAFLAQTGLLGPAVLDIVHGQFDAPALLRLARARRRRSGQYLLMLAAAQPPRRRGLRLRLMQAAAEATPEHTLYGSRLAILLYRAGRDAEAEAWHRRVLAMAPPDDPRFLFRLSLFLQRHGRYAEAAELAAQAAALDPLSAALARHLARLRLLAGAGGPRWRMPVRLALQLHNAALHRAARLAWRRGWADVGRLEQP